MWVLRPERDIPVSAFTPLRVTALLLLAWVSGVWSTERNGGLIKSSWSLLRMEKLSHLNVTSAKRQVCTADGLELWCAKSLSTSNYTQHKSWANTRKQILITKPPEGQEASHEEKQGDASTRSRLKPLMLQRAFLTHRIPIGSLGASFPFWKAHGWDEAQSCPAAFTVLLSSSEKSFDGH